MTVRVTTLKGPDAGAYYVEHLPNYYLSAGEPRGRWGGEGAAMLSLHGEVEDGPFLALMAGHDPHAPGCWLGKPYDDRSVRGFDVTASAPKSVSLLFAIGDETTRRHALAAHDGAVAAMAGWIERHAHTRYRINGEVAVVDADGIVGALFRQHTSRALDPQLHTHLVIPNRVKSPDGRWLALDARAIKRDQRTLSALYHAALRAELVSRLGVRWHQPVNGIAEIADLPHDLLAAFSARTEAARRRLDAKLDRFEDTMDRKPTMRERWTLEREAVVESRPPKVDPAYPSALHQTWLEQATALGWPPERLLDATIRRVRSTVNVSAEQLVERAVDALTEKQSTWRPAEVLREVAAVLPTDLALTANDTVARAEALAAEAVAGRCVDISRPVHPGIQLRRDGRPITEAATDRALTTQLILDQEEHVIASMERRLAWPGGDHLDAPLRNDRRLTATQANVAAKVAGTDSVVFVVGPAGTGKTTALRPAVAQLLSDGRAAFGVAPNANAATVLADETGADSDTVDKLLTEHRLARPPQHRYDLPSGATVIVDEAGMLSTANFAALTDLADRKVWRLAFVGDPLQFSAVGRGGMFAHLVNEFGATELDRVHRFAHDWERAASLRLRSGDIEVAEMYDAHARLAGGTSSEMERRCIRRWWQHREAGMTSLLMATTNDRVDRLNQLAQLLRIQRCELDPHGPTLAVGHHTIHIGDEIATRKNNRLIRTDRGKSVKNRATWTVTAIQPDGSIAATGKSGSANLPAEYVRQHVDLAYAVTVMGAQGRTVDGAMLLLDRPTDVRGVYVAMSRGVHTNEAYIITDGEDTALDVFERCVASDWIDEPAVARRAELLLADDEANRQGREREGQSPQAAHSARTEFENGKKRSMAAEILDDWSARTGGLSVEPDDRSTAERILDEWRAITRGEVEPPGHDQGLSL